MRGLDPLGLHGARLFVDDNARTEFILIQRTLQRLMAFTGHTIDDVVNDPIVKNKFLGYYKLHRQINRHSEALELERQWNPLHERGPAPKPREASIDAPAR